MRRNWELVKAVLLNCADKTPLDSKWDSREIAYHRMILRCEGYLVDQISLSWKGCDLLDRLESEATGEVHDALTTEDPTFELDPEDEVELDDIPRPVFKSTNEEVEPSPERRIRKKKANSDA